ncbi:MAG: hypothetical protein HKO53_19155 [Gemmatimonadetes bacterium]|nr:hypothetical protein [Gemmatimonadota bacterium]
MQFKRLMIALLAVAACADDPTAPDSPTPPSPSEDPAGHYAGERTYRVTIYNLTDGQPLTPPIVAAHRGGLRIFSPGRTASEGITQLAENGNGAPLLAYLEGEPRVYSIATAGAPVLPHGFLSLDIVAGHEATRLSWASMLICTNDGFTGLRGIRLPTHVGQKKTRVVGGYDAGTGINTEDFSDIVPPCPLLTGIDTDKEGTGMSDPALAQGGRIRHHRGIQGGADLLASVHGWRGPVARVVVERLS